MLQEICRITFDEQTLKDDLGNYTYANNLDPSIAQYVENGDGFALSTLNLFTKQGPYFQIDTTSEFYHQFENNDYFEISFDVFFTNIVGYAKHICYFQAYDDISQKYVSFGARLSCNVYPNTYDSYLSDITTITTNKWYTFRIVVDNKNNVVNVYQDDVLIISWNNTYHFIPTSVCVGNIAALDRVYNYSYVDNISIKTEIQLLPPTIEINQSGNRLNTVVSVDERLTDKTVQYEWNNGATTEYIDITESGNYTCTVTDSNSQSSTATIYAEYIEPPEPIEKIVSYPDDLLSPLQSQYKMSFAPNILVPTIQGGSTEYRQLTENAPYTVNCTIILRNQSEYQSFIKFYDDIKQGADYFLMPLIGGKKKCHLVQGKYTDNLQFRNEIGAVRYLNLQLEVENDLPTVVVGNEFVYPNNIPLPRQEGYTVTETPNVISNKMLDGRTRQRRLTKSRKYAQLDCSFFFNQNDLDVFYSFWKNVLKEGSQWFDMPILNETDDLIGNKKVRFIEGKFDVSLYCRNKQTFLYDVNASFEVDINE